MYKEMIFKIQFETVTKEMTLSSHTKLSENWLEISRRKYPQKGSYNLRIYRGNQPLNNNFLTWLGVH